MPSNAVSGLYLAHLVRDDGGGSGNGSLIPFVVRNDASHSDILFQTDDETWQAYNTYGGNSLYQLHSQLPAREPRGLQGRRRGVLQPAVDTAADRSDGSWFIYAEFPMIEFLEENGYDVSYTSGVDTSQPGAASIIEQHKIFLYRRPRRVLVRPAACQRHSRPRRRREPGLLHRERGVLEDQVCAEHRRIEHAEPDAGHLQGDSLQRSDGSAGPAYLDGELDGSAVQPAGGRRESAELADRPAVRRQRRHHATSRCRLSTASCGSGATPRVASLSSGQSTTLDPGVGTLGYEWDVDADNGFRPPGLMDLSSTTDTEHAAVSRLRQYHHARRHRYRDPPPDLVPRAERRPGVRRRNGAVVVGSGQWGWASHVTPIRPCSRPR